jgi:hypothetical protein
LIGLQRVERGHLTFASEEVGAHTAVVIELNFIVAGSFTFKEARIGFKVVEYDFAT